MDDDSFEPTRFAARTNSGVRLYLKRQDQTSTCAPVSSTDGRQMASFATRTAGSGCARIVAAAAGGRLTQWMGL